MEHIPFYTSFPNLPQDLTAYLLQIFYLYINFMYKTTEWYTYTGHVHLSLQSYIKDLLQKNIKEPNFSKNPNW